MGFRLNNEFDGMEMLRKHGLIQEEAPDTVTPDELEEQLRASAEVPTGVVPPSPEELQAAEDAMLPEVDQIVPEEPVQRAPAITQEAPQVSPLSNLISSMRPNRQEDLQRAQEQARSTRLVAQLGKAASQIGAGIAGAKTPDSSLFDEVARGADAPIKELQQRMAMEAKDPSSDLSKMYQEMALKTMPNLNPEQVSKLSSEQLKSVGVKIPTKMEEQMMEMKMDEMGLRKRKLGLEEQKLKLGQDQLAQQKLQEAQAAEIYREKIRKIHPNLKDDPRLDKLSLAQLQKVFKLPSEMTPYQKGRLGEMQKGEERRKKEQLVKFNEKIYDVTQDYENDTVVKEMKKQGIAFDQADSLIQQMDAGNQMALGPLGTKMARAMGEVGVLTDQDVVRYVQAQGISQKVRDYFSKQTSGKISNPSTKDLKDITAIMKIGFQGQKKKMFNKYAKKAYRNFGKHMNMTFEEVAQRFGSDLNLDVPPQYIKAMNFVEENLNTKDKELKKKVTEAQKVLRSKGFY